MSIKYKECKPLLRKAKKDRKGSALETTDTLVPLQKNDTARRRTTKVQKFIENIVRWDPRPCLGTIAGLLRVTLSVIAVSLSAFKSRITWGIKTVNNTIAGICKCLVCFLVQSTPRKYLKHIVIFLCNVTPNLRSRWTALLVFRNIPSHLTKYLLMQYFGRAPLWVLNCHAKLFFLRCGPLKVLVAVRRLSRVPVWMVEVVVGSLESLLQVGVRFLKLCGRQQIRRDSKRRLWRSFSRQASVNNSKENMNEE